MADCIPNSLENLDRNPTPGEKKVFNLLEKLPSNCIVWYELILQEMNLRPDFMVLDAQRGVCIIEVKDWGKETIKLASPKEFRIQMGGNRPVRVQNPKHKCAIYVASAKERLSLIEELVDQNYLLKIPFTYLIAMPNLSQADYDEIKLEDILDREKVLFSEDLKAFPAFLKRFEQAMPLLTTPLHTKQLTIIRRELRDEITINNTTDPDGMIRENVEIVASHVADGFFEIDLEQEKIAKGLGEGPRLMRGLAGTGKTLVMLIKARIIASNAEYNQRPKKILILCWNISLANYMRQAFDFINIPLHQDEGATYVEIKHFMGWAREIIIKKRGYKAFPLSSQPDFEDQVTTLLNLIKIPEQEQYDAVYIDEFQDFKSGWIHIIFHKFVKGKESKTKNFIAAGDHAQQIIRGRDQIGFREEKITWASLGIPMQGRSKVLRTIYRNSARMWALAGLFYGNVGQDYEDEDGKSNAGIKFTEKPGHDPELIECRSSNAQITEALRTVQKVIKSNYSLRNVLILYRRKTLRNGYKMVEKLLEAFDEHDIRYEWITEDVESRAKFNWAEESVKISTVHSAKGLDAPIVIILNAEAFDSSEEETDEKKLMYVALTRAREYIKILYTGENDMVVQLKEAMQKYERFRPKVLEFEQQARNSI